MATTFSTTFKNGYLTSLVKAGTSDVFLYGRHLTLWNASNARLTEQYPLPQTAFNTPVAGVASRSAPTTRNPSVSGEVEYAQLALGAQVLVQMDVTAVGEGGDVELDTTAVTAGVPVGVHFSIKVPSGNGSIKFNQALCQAIAQTILTGMDAQAMALGGVLSFYSGTKPATADTGLSGNTLLASFTLSTHDFLNPSLGTILLAAAKTISATATGTATFFRWTKGGFVIDGTVGTTGADFTLSTTSLVSGVSFQLTAATLTAP